MKRVSVALKGAVRVALLGCILAVDMAGQVYAATPTPPAGQANLALRKSASQSSTDYGGDAGRAVDGNTDGSYFGANSVSHTNNQPQQWWQVDLGAVYPIQSVRIWNRTDCCADRLSRFYVFVSDTPLPAGNVQAAQNHPGVWSSFFDRTAGRTTDIPVNRNGRYLRIQLAGANYLQLAEVEVIGRGAGVAQPQPTPPVCDVAGTWRHGTGNETWTFTPQGGGRYLAQEKGYGNARGPAVVSGNRLRIDYTTQDGKITGFYDLALSSDCTRGDGRWQDARPAGGSAAIVRVSPAPAPQGGRAYTSLPIQPPPPPPSACASESMIYTNGNIAGVQNQPTQPTHFQVAQPVQVTYFMTYHWNNARGQAPGRIGFRHQDGTMYGPWQATSAPGQGGVPNAYWIVRPNVTLKPGTYAVLDSDPASWAQNAQSHGQGMIEVKGCGGTAGAPPPGPGGRAYTSMPIQPPNAVSGLPLNQAVWLRSINYPNMYLRHQSALADLTALSSDQDRSDATFRIVPGLADNRMISFESVNQPGHFLRHQGGRVKLHQRAGDQLFLDDATYKVVPGLADASWVSFESKNYPGYYIRHRNFQVWVERGSDDLFRKDSTFRFEGRGAPVVSSHTTPPVATGAITWDFETGDLRGWAKTGNAFDFQPTYGDNPTARNRGQASQHQGSYWIGGYEKRPRQTDQAGQVQGDGPQGTLTSQPFTIQRPAITFLIGGGCDVNTVRAELIVDGQAVLRVTGRCTETMERARWDVSRYVGRRAQIRLVDQSGDGWGHINFDDVRFEQ